MAKRRGFFAEMQHQARLAEQRQRAMQREIDAQARRQEQARKAEHRAFVAAERASVADQKARAREEAAAHVEAMQAEVEYLNRELNEVHADIDGLLVATLDVDNYVDLESLKKQVSHPPFSGAQLERPTQLPQTIPAPQEPFRQPVPPPAGLFGRKKKTAELAQQMEEAFLAAHYSWHNEMQSLPQRRAAQTATYERTEQHRLQRLALERAKYAAECAKRESEVAEHNASVDAFIANLGYGAVDAVQDYVGLVLENSIYPNHFEVTHEADFEPTTAELTIRTLVPDPTSVPAVKAYKYTKTSDQITTTALSQKDAKDRYAGAVHQVALRTLHEVFEADRRKIVQSISLEVGTETINPATGNETYLPFVAVSSSREAFESLDLSEVVPAATLEHLGATVSKNPHGLMAAKTGGIRTTQ